MTPSADPVDVFLQPGEFHFGDANTTVRTLLGSCVAIAMWHPMRRIGGMSHCLLPTDSMTRRAADPDGRFVDEALMLLIREAVRENTNPADYRIKLFGGSDMFTRRGLRDCTPIGHKNATAARCILDVLGLPVAACDVGGEFHRSIIFEISTGDVWVRLGTGDPAVPLVDIFAA